MNEAEKAEVIRRYDERIAQHGYRPEALGWTKGRHELRYGILLSQWDVAGCAVLDFGCGFGDLFGYCVSSGLDVSYEGVDINPTLIDEARRRYPDVSFTVRDALADGLDRTYDFILSSGVHNFALQDNWAFIEATFELFSRHATQGFAVNFLSDRVEWQLDGAWHMSPVRALELAFKFSNRVVLRNDYMPFEFTVFVDRRTAFDPSLAVYPEYVDRLVASDRPSGSVDPS